MRLVAYEANGKSHIGCVTAGGIVEVGSKLNATSWRQVIAAGRLDDVRQYEALPADHALDAVKYLPPISDPEHFYCVGVNYADHLKEVQDAGISRPAPKQPSLFIRFPETLIGHECSMTVPRVSSQLDYEAELAVVIGRGGRYIPRDEALEHVAAYTCFNDGSIRDWQFHTSQVTSGKNFIGTGGLGPWLVTADEVPDAGNLDISLTINGEVLQSSNTSHLIFDIPSIISYASALVPLKPGDIIATGTPSGVGFSRNPPVFLKPGDICEVHIERLGVLRNSVALEAGTSPAEMLNG